MAFVARTLRVMIASPSDVVQERVIVREVIHEWNAIHAEKQEIVLLPVGWETDSAPEMGGRAQEVINKQILKNADILVAVFWTRLGSSTGKEASGTVEEIKEHVAAEKLAMLYFSSVPVRPDSVDEVQYSALKAFREECKSRGLYETFAETSEFRTKFARHLALHMHAVAEKLGDLTHANRGGAKQTEKSLKDTISEDARTLLKTASKDSDGHIVFVRFIGGVSIQTAGVDFMRDKPADPRLRARWEGAVRELVSNGLLDGNDEIYHLTSLGYQLADSLADTVIL